MNKIKQWEIRIFKSSIFSLILGMAVFIFESMLGDYIVQWLNSKGISISNFLAWLINQPTRSSVIVFFITLTILIVIDFRKDKGVENPKVNFIPRKNKPGMWEEYSTWLEIVSDNEDISDCYAILKTLEFSKDGMKINCLEAVSNSVAPRLQCSKGKITIASTKNLSSAMIALEDGYKELPKSDSFHIQVLLKKNTRIMAVFDSILHFNYFGSDEVLWLEPERH